METCYYHMYAGLHHVPHLLLFYLRFPPLSSLCLPFMPSLTPPPPPRAGRGVGGARKHGLIMILSRPPAPSHPRHCWLRSSALATAPLFVFCFVFFLGLFSKFHDTAVLCLTHGCGFLVFFCFL